MSVFEENMARYRERERPFVGGVYGEAEARILGFTPQLAISKVIDAVIIDSRAKTTKFFPTQTYPIDIQDEKDIDAGTDFATQVIGKFDRPINDLRNVTIPLFGISHQNFVNAPLGGSNTDDTLGILLFDLLKVDLNSGTFKLEDLTWALAHKPVRVDLSTSSLYSDSNNFITRGVAAINGFELYLHRSRATFNPSFGSNITDHRVTLDEAISPLVVGPVDNPSSFWFYDNVGRADKAFGEQGPYTGILMYFNPLSAGGGLPPPSGAGDTAHVKARLPDPKPGQTATNTNGRFPFAIGSGFNVIEGD